jgi:Skp family chaperone for outer membrane proteins
MKMRIAELVNGSDEQKQLQAKLDAENAALQEKMKAERARFLRAESDAYYASYNTVQEVVEALARERSIRLVLRHNTEIIKPAERQSVLQGVNRAVVFQDGLDITADVIKRLN